MSEAEEYDLFEAYADCDFECNNAFKKAVEAMAKLDQQWAEQWSEKVQALLQAYWEKAVGLKVAQTEAEEALDT